MATKRDAASTLAAQLAAAQAQIDALTLELDTLRAGKRPAYRARAEWKLSPTQERIFLVLLEQPQVSADVLAAAAMGQDSKANTLSQHVHNLRRRLKPFGITISAVWGRGYALENRAAVKALLRSTGSAAVQ